MKEQLKHLAIIHRNWREDPVGFVYRVFNRRAGSVSRGALAVVDRLLSVRPSSRTAALSALVLEESETLTFRLNEALERAPHGKRAQYFADVALHAQLPGLSGEFAARIGGRQGTARTLANLDFYQGRLEEAIERLASAETPHRRMLERMRGERAVFHDWVPRLRAVSDYRPAEATVLHLLTNSVPYTSTGYTYRSQSLLGAQAAEGWDVHAVTRRGYPESIGVLDAPESETVDGVVYHRLPAAAVPPGLDARLQREAEELLSLALRLRPAVLHTTTHFVNGLVVRAVAEALGIPWVYEVRGQLADTWASKHGTTATSTERYQRFVAREAEVQRSAAAVFTLGRAMRERIIRSGTPEERVFILPNGVGSAYLEPPLEHAKAKAAVHLDSDRLHIGTVSSLVDYEGLDDLLTAYAQIAAERRDVELVIVGDGAAMPRLRAHAISLGLEPAAIFRGRVPAREAPLWHRALDVFVVPRKDFQVTRTVTPLKPVEAMASERPVVVADLPALTELVRPGESGLAVPPEDPAALATALRQLLEDKELRMSMGRHGRREVLTHRTWPRNAQISIEAYQLAMSGRSTVVTVEEETA
ncbi:glycosyltransferase family 4 protein [Zhihengliuella flava]|uniref:D-inositol 3-phosphate glycosyltransferase n=1 Tax=Zhihengliuella flava TaxID=1285193 RepID=A0A931D708_9MICC|nr:glycosyltransferase family 4 protein [Zhihengliuella flava]MBG6083557.1 glycosyltransferase involved in cell wall biosynthesis [Zhihengliuella flava]